MDRITSLADEFRWVESARVLAAAATLWLLAPAGSALATDWDWIVIAPDIAVEMNGILASHRQPAISNGSGQIVYPVDMGPLPQDVAIDAHDRIQLGVELFSVEQPTVLPGGLTVEPADVVRWNLDTGQYTMEFDGSANGIPKGANVDAVSAPSGFTPMLLSFDTTVELGGVVVADEDLVAWDGPGSYSLFFDGSSRGFDPALDLDGADFMDDLPDSRTLLVVSFDGAGKLAWIDFADEDLLEYDVWEDTWDTVYAPGYTHGYGVRRSNTQSVSARPVPEPAELLMLAAGVGFLCAVESRRGRAQPRLA
jgi:hypothetical protein